MDSPFPAFVWAGSGGAGERVRKVPLLSFLWRQGRRFAPVLRPGWNMMFPAVSGNLKSCLKAVQSVLADTRRAPMPVLILV